MSLMVMWMLGFAFTMCAWCNIRKAMSPVPPATSRMRWGEGGVLEECPGFREETKWSLFEVVSFGFLFVLYMCVRGREERGERRGKRRTSRCDASQKTSDRSCDHMTRLHCGKHPLPAPSSPIRKDHPESRSASSADCWFLYCHCCLVRMKMSYQVGDMWDL